MSKGPAWKEELRRKAEGRTAEKKYAYPDGMTPDEMCSALHELNVHQIELEMQNEELREAQAEIARAGERYFDLYDLAPVGYCTLSEKGIILEANLKAASLCGATRGELIDKPFSRFVYMEDQDAYYLRMLSLIEKGESQSFELRMKRNDTFFWADVNASVLEGMDGQRVCRITISDITGHKQDEERQLFQSNLLTSVHDAIIAVDENLNVSYWNGIAEDITGWMSEEVVGMPARNLYNQIIVSSVMEEIIQSFHRNSFYLGEITAIRRDGEPFIADVHIQGITGPDGRRRGVVASFRDITERKQAEEALRSSEEELMEADRNKNEFLNTLSHELRNPLAAISAGIQLLDITTDEDQIKTAKNIMKRHMDQLCALVDDLLDITRISNNKIELKKEKIELNRLVSLTAEDHRALFDEKEIKLQTRICDIPIYIEADPIRIKQIIGNLLQNARKYTRTGGETILGVYKENNDAVISVKDSGIGLSPELIPRLFQPFVQADMSLDRSGGGLGLGLSITKGIAEMHGGTVNAYSEGLGKGSEFTIRLPLSGAEGNDKADEAKQEDVSVHPLKVLIIEDNRDFADLLSTMLAMAGHQVKVSYDGHGGLEKAKLSKPDVIFCDIGLPGMDGFEVAKAIKENAGLKNALLVALTGYAGEDDLKHAKESGFDRHMAKPVSLAAIQQLLNEY